MNIIDTMVNKLSDDRLREFCLLLGIDYYELPRDGKRAKIVELIGFLQRRDREDDLVQVGKQLRPDIEWSQLVWPPKSSDFPIPVDPILPTQTGGNINAWVIGILLVAIIGLVGYILVSNVIGNIASQPPTRSELPDKLETTAALESIVEAETTTSQAVTVETMPSQSPMVTETIETTSSPTNTITPSSIPVPISTATPSPTSTSPTSTSTPEPTNTPTSTPTFTPTPYPCTGFSTPTNLLEQAEITNLLPENDDILGNCFLTLVTGNTIRIPYAPSLEPAEGTIEIIFRKTAQNMDAAITVRKGRTPNDVSDESWVFTMSVLNESLGFTWVDSDPTDLGANDGVDNASVGASDMVADCWNHAAISWVDGKITFFMNGAPRDSMPLYQIVTNTDGIVRGFAFTETGSLLIQIEGINKQADIGGINIYPGAFNPANASGFPRGCE